MVMIGQYYNHAQRLCYRPPKVIPVNSPYKFLKLRTNAQKQLIFVCKAPANLYLGRVILVIISKIGIDNKLSRFLLKSAHNGRLNFDGYFFGFRHIIL